MAQLVLFKITKSTTDAERVYQRTFFPCACVGGGGEGRYTNGISPFCLLRK